MNKFWLCYETFRGTGRPSRVWVEESETSPDTPVPSEPDNAVQPSYVPYPFNGMGGHVQAGPFDTEADAWAHEETLTEIDDRGYWQWKRDMPVGA